MSEYGAEERALFEERGQALYEDVVKAGILKRDDPRIAPDSPDHAAFELLLRMGLLVNDHAEDAFQPVDPGSVQSRVVSPLGVEGARLLEESAHWARTFGSLNQVWRRSPQAESRGPFNYIRDEAIGAFIAGAVAEAEEEMLTAQPQTGRDAKSLEAAAARDMALLERGCKMRTLYQHSARRSSITHKYVASVSARGAEVRTLDEFFNRIIIIDRRLAIIPAQEDLRAAMAVREPSVVDYLVDIFERTWERARPFTNRESAVMSDIAAEQRAMTIRMLIEGHSDPISAKRLGVSPRTYAGYVADLKDEYEAQTRFQLGYTMGKLGVSGRETTDG